MHPRSIKARLRRVGITQADIARQVGVSKVTVHEVIHRRRQSGRVRAAITNALGCQHEKVWGAQRPKFLMIRNLASGDGDAAAAPRAGGDDQEIIRRKSADEPCFEKGAV